jgi:Caspase domain
MRFFFLVTCFLFFSTGATAQNTLPEPVHIDELKEIRLALQGINLAKADVTLAPDGRVMLTGEYEDRDAVERAFAVARAIVGLRRVAPTTPAQITYRLKGFESAFASTLGKMMAAPPRAENAVQVPSPQSVRPNAKHIPQTYALLLGIGRYQHLPASANLEGAVKDAQDVYTFLTKKLESPLPPSAVVLLKNQEATSNRVKQQFKYLVDTAQSGDTVVFFVATHGVPNALGKFDVVLYDTEFPVTKLIGLKQGTDMNAPRRSTALTDDDMQRFISQLVIKGVRTVLILDTCYSGKTFVAVPGYLPSRTRSLTQHQQEVAHVAAPAAESILEISSQAKDSRTARMVLVAASENETSAEHPEVGGGLFTQLYLQALFNNRDYANAFDIAKPLIIRRARTFGHSQTPRLLVVPEDAKTAL